MTPSPSPAPHAAIVGLKPGSLVQGWRVFPDLEVKPREDESPEDLERRTAVAARYQGLIIDVRRLPRATCRRYSQRVALAASGWDDLPKDPANREEREAAAEGAERIARELSQVFRELLLEPVAAAGEGALCLACVHGITVKLVGGETTPIGKLPAWEQVDLLEELDLLDAVGRAALKAQSLEEYNLRL